jgi:hypothetical protein
MSCNIISKCGKDSLMIQNPFNVPINELGDTGLIILLFVLGIYIYIYKKNSCIIIIVSGFSY